jgi:hypothetical protein
MEVFMEYEYAASALDSGPIQESSGNPFHPFNKPDGTGWRLIFVLHVKEPNPRTIFYWERPSQAAVAPPPS